MNIGHVYWLYFPASIGGIETYIDQVSQLQQEQGDHPVIITGKYSIKCDDKNLEGKVKVYREKAFERAIGDNENKNDYERAYSRMKQIIKEESLEILHLHNLHFRYNFLKTMGILRAAKEMNTPTILHVHGIPKDEVSQYILRKMPWDRVISISKWISSQIYEMGVSADDITLIYNGTDTKWFKPGEPDKEFIESIGGEGKIIIGTPARLITSSGEIAYNKGYMQIIKALSRVKDFKENFKWILTGGKFPNEEWMNNAKNKMRDYTKIYGIEDQSIIGLEVPKEDMPKFYNSLDIMLMPSINEPFGLSTIEAMASGKVVIGANSGATPEIIRNGKNGYMVHPKDPIALAELLIELASDLEKQNSVRINGRRTVEEKFSLNRMVDELRNTYEEVIQ